MRVVARHSCSPRTGSVLVAVLVMVVLLTLAAYQFSELMVQEYTAANSAMKATQARAVADSGIYYVAAMLADPESAAADTGFYDDDSLKGVLVGDDGRRTGRFSIVAPYPKDEAPAGRKFRFGVTDEAGKLNVNALVASGVAKQTIRAILLKLPNMTDEIADAIIDWVDADDSPQPSGAESAYYSALDPSYRCKNGPLDSVEELLLVRGVTPQLLFGTDRNRNGLDDPGEDDGNGWDPGWAAHLTVYSRFRNVDSEGQPRINLNQAITQTYYDDLKTAVGQPLADFIVLAGQNNLQADSSNYTKSEDEVKQAVIQATIQRGNLRPSFSSAWELFSKTVSITVEAPAAPMGGRGGAGGGGGRTTTASRPRTVNVRNPLSDQGQQQQLLPQLLDKTTTQSGQELPARINVLTAPKEVLTCLTGLGGQGGLTDADVQSILDARPGLSDGPPEEEMFHTTAWLYLEAKITPTKMAALERYLTSRTQVYRVQSLGYFDGGGPVARVEAVVDTNDGKPRILMWRDLSELGKGYNLDQ